MKVFSDIEDKVDLPIGHFSHMIWGRREEGGGRFSSLFQYGYVGRRGRGLYTYGYVGGFSTEQCLELVLALSQSERAFIDTG